jgi:hypothetical protein
MTPPYPHRRLSTPRNAAAGLAIMLIALLVMAVFLSQSLVSVVYDLPPGPLADRLASWAEAWDGAMRAIGATRPAEWVTALVERIRSARF